MRTLRSIRWAWAAAALSLMTGAGPVAGQPAPGLDTPVGAIRALQRAQEQDGNALVLQSDLDGLIDKDGGGACAAAAAIDLLQTLRVMAGFDRLPNPHRVALEAFRDGPDLLKGRVANQRFVDLIHYLRTRLGDSQIDVRVASSPTSGYRTHQAVWDEGSGPDFDLAARTAKVVCYSVTAPDGHALGRHFVLLKARAGDEIDVLDPRRPTREIKYSLAHKPGDRGRNARVLLENLPGVPRRGGYVFEVDTIFTVRVAGGAAGAVPADAVEAMCRKVDDTAAELRGTPDFVNPRAWRKKTASFGLPGLDLPAAVGGGNWPAVGMVEVFRRAGRHNLNFRDVVGGAHGRPLLKSSDPYVTDVVRQVACGDGYVAIAITEPEAGTDIPAIKSTARKVEGGYVLNGTKRFNARLDQATHVVIFTQGAATAPGKLSAFVVPIDAPGLTVERFPAPA